MDTPLLSSMPSHITVNARHVRGEGWVITITSIEPGSTWSSARTVRYDRLDRAELLQVLESEIESLLRLA